MRSQVGSFRFSVPIGVLLALICIITGDAHGGKKERRLTRRMAPHERVHEVLALCTRRGARPPSKRVQDEYFAWMEQSAALVPSAWWAELRLQADAELVAARAGAARDGFVWVRRPTLHKRVRFGQKQVPLLDFGAVRDDEAARYRCGAGSYEEFFAQHERGDLTPLDVLAIDPYMHPDGQAAKERELAQVILEGALAGKWTRITGSYVSEVKGVIVDALHFQYPDGRALCLSVCRPLVETARSRRKGGPRPEGYVHTRDGQGGVRFLELQPQYQGQPVGEMRLPSPERMRRLLDGIRMMELRSPEPLTRMAARILGLR